jgi:NADH-quinone oxidoreductase subunit A
MLFDFANILVFIIVGVGTVFAALLFSRLLAPSKPNPDKASTYECGERILGTSWIKFNIRFYVIALIYIIFAVEIAVLFPWAVVFKSLGESKWIGFIEMIVFVGLLGVGLAYLWYKGDLDWVKQLNTSDDKKQIEEDND